jgi:hypothetical protein
MASSYDPVVFAMGGIGTGAAVDVVATGGGGGGAGVSGEHATTIKTIV